MDKEYLVHIGASINIEKRRAFDEYIAANGLKIRSGLEKAIDLLVAQK